MRRSKRASPAKRQIEAQDEITCRAEGAGYCDQERARAIRACTMRERQAGAGLFGRVVQEAVNPSIFELGDVFGHDL